MIATSKDNGEELFPLVTEEGEIIGAARRAECHDGSKKLHPVVHLHVFDTSGRLFLQKRPAWKDIQPNKWDTAVGGHIDLGENVEQALRREAEEELGIQIQRVVMYKEPDENDVFSSASSALSSSADAKSALSNDLFILPKEEQPTEHNVAYGLPPYVFESSRERELVYPFRIIYDGEVKPSAETDGGRFWHPDELQDAMGQETLTPNFESEYARLKF